MKQLTTGHCSELKPSCSLPQPGVFSSYVLTVIGFPPLVPLCCLEGSWWEGLLVQMGISLEHLRVPLSEWKF